MDTVARLFDAPVGSAKHAELRNTAWMGGDLVEGRYLLGMLLGENLFRLSDDEYLYRLHGFVSTRISRMTADIFCIHAPQQLMPYLRRRYHLDTDHPPIDEKRNDRVERALEYFLHNLDASDAEIAGALGTTEKQVARISDLTAARAAIRRHRASKPDTE